MGEKEEDAAASAHRRQAMRIYIGGVGPTVTAADVEKTFSPLGRVAGVEFVSTNGRNFAYMDFEPTSEKTLAKLFSTYNGCTWKGGKLKLERAKESYLDCLKREWAEDAKLMSETPIDPKIEKDLSSSKLQRLNLEGMQLQIFFPKLRKVRSLPFKGTGKHKYSFQRIEVPPLPIHFCDCEEHRGPSETASQKYLSYLNSGIHYEKELNIMNSVMNKLFEKEGNGLITDKEPMLTTAENATDPSIDDICEEESEEEALEMDTDNLVTNIGMGRTDDMLMQLVGYTQAVHQESRASTHQSSKKELSTNKENTKREKGGRVDASEVTANKKDIAELPVKITENEFTAILSQNMSSEGHFQEPDISAEPPHENGQTEPSMIATQSANGQSWLQKSSWKDLVGGTGKSSFSITNVLPGTCSLLPTKSKSSDPATDTFEAKKIKAHPTRKNSKTLPDLEDPCLEKVKTKKGQRAGPVDALHATVNKKPNPALSVKSTENEFTVSLPQNTSSDGQSPEPEISVEPPVDKGEAEPSTIATQSTKSQSWLQKSSWKDLVGGMESSSFSITNVLPGISSLQTTQPKSIDSLTEAKKIKAQPDRKTPKTSPAVKNSPLEKASADDEMLGKGDHIQAHAVGDEQREPPKTGDQEQEPRSTRPEVGTSEVCTFMRSDESLKQWAKAKAALSRQLNKKRKKSEDDSPKSLKGVGLRKR